MAQDGAKAYVDMARSAYQQERPALTTIENGFFLSSAKIWAQRKKNSHEAAQQKPPGVRHLAALLLDLYSRVNGGE